MSGLKNKLRFRLPRHPSQGGYHVRLAAINKAYHLSADATRGYKKLLGVAFGTGCGYALGMAHGEFTRRKFTRLGDGGVSEVWETAETLPQTLAYLDHHPSDGESTATVFTPTTGRSIAYLYRPEGAALRIVERHLEREGYKNCLSFQDLTAESDAAKL